jgi:dolichol-phosphate mannosyltransferase
LDLSIVVPIFNEEENVSALHREVVAALDTCGITYELILVDDGSTDG